MAQAVKPAGASAGGVRRPRVMGVLNVTPDSFSDGGRFATVNAAAAQASALIEAGADILDVGGESTRPGAEPVSLDEELARVLPVITAIRGFSDVEISIDTRKPAVAQAAVGAGASMWNDITALQGTPHSLDVAARLGCEVVLMHMQGEPRTMQASPHYDDVVAEVRASLRGRGEAALAAGVDRDKIWLDPGIGFGKRLDHNLALLAGLSGANILVAIVADLIMILTGLFAALTVEEGPKWGYYAMACLAYLVIIYQLAVNGRGVVQNKDKKTATFFSAIAGFTLILWTIYPM